MRPKVKQIVSVPKKTKSMRKNGNYSLFLELVKKKKLVCVNPRRKGERDTFRLPLVESALRIPRHLKHILFRLIPSQDTVSWAPWALMASLHLSICTNRGFHFKAPLSRKHSCITSDFFPKHRDQHSWDVSSSRKTIPAPLDFRGYKSPSNSVTRETVQDAEPGPLPTSSLPSADQGKQVAEIHSTLRFFNQGGHRSPHC